jgi:pyrimidine operon attenuation protein/uracil phosphoribosyltransferase
MCDVSRLTTRESARRARIETIEAIQRNDEAMKAGSPTGSAALADRLQRELNAINDLILANDW